MIYPPTKELWFSRARDFVGYAIGSGDCELAIVHNLAGDEEGSADSEQRARVFAASYDMQAALRALLDWGRDHTSPRDPNSPHALLVAAAAALAKTEAAP